MAIIEEKEEGAELSSVVEPVTTDAITGNVSEQGSGIWQEMSSRVAFLLGLTVAVAITAVAILAIVWNMFVK